MLVVPPPRGRLVAPTSLVEIVHTAVQGMGESSLWPLGEIRANVAFQARSMLALLTYCYARQCYSSVEIRDFLTRDATFRGVCQNSYPSPSWISQFRQHNREAIQKCLTEALLFLARQKEAAGFMTRINEPFIIEEAKRRIIMAACTDSLEAEDQDLQPMLDEPFAAA